jgi:hypothetical protein
MGGTCSTYKVDNFFVGEPAWKTPLRKPRRRWKDNNKTNLNETDCGGVDWINVARDEDK